MKEEVVHIKGDADVLEMMKEIDDAFERLDCGIEVEVCRKKDEYQFYIRYPEED